MRVNKCPHCPRKYNSAPALMEHQLEDHPEEPEKARKRKGWVTPHGFADFKEPVTYEEACVATEVVSRLLAERKNQ